MGERSVKKYSVRSAGTNGSTYEVVDPVPAPISSTRIGRSAGRSWTTRETTSRTIALWKRAKGVSSFSPSASARDPPGKSSSSGSLSPRRVSVRRSPQRVRSVISARVDGRRSSRAAARRDRSFSAGTLGTRATSMDPVLRRIPSSARMSRKRPNSRRYPSATPRRQARSSIATGSPSRQSQPSRCRARRM